MGRRYRYVLGTALVGLVLAAAGCGGGGVDEADSISTTLEPGPTSEPVSPSSVPTEDQGVLAAYQGYWDTWLVANDPPNPDHPDLERYAAGAALAKVKQSIAQRRSVGVLMRLPEGSRYRHRATVETLGVTAATLTDCSIDDAVLVANGSGRILDATVVSRQLRAELSKVGERWFTENVVAVQEWDGVAGCAA